MDGFLDELETLTHRARMRRMVQVGRDVVAGDANARVLVDALWATGRTYERTLALQSVYGSREGNVVVAAVREPSRTLRYRALRLLVTACDDAAIGDVLAAAPSRPLEKHLLALLQRRGRSAAIEALLGRPGALDDPRSLDLLPLAPAPFVTLHLDAFRQHASPVGWRRLAKHLPAVAAAELARAVDAGLDMRTRQRVLADLVLTARGAPDAVLPSIAKLLVAGERPAPAAINELLRRRPAETFDVLRAADERVAFERPPGPFAGVRLASVVHRLGPDRIAYAVRRAHPALPDGRKGRRWLLALDAAEREAALEAWSGAHGIGAWGGFLLRHFAVDDPRRDRAFARWVAAARDGAGIVSVRRLADLPHDLRHREAARHLDDVSKLQGKPERLAYAALLPFARAQVALASWLSHPEGELRAPAIAALVGTLDGDRTSIGGLLAVLKSRRFEQDPVRLAMLGALADQPAACFPPEVLPDVATIVEHALAASDLSMTTARHAERLVVRLFRVDPEWGAAWLAKIAQARGVLVAPGLATDLVPADVVRCEHAFAKLVATWRTKERAGSILWLARSLGKRLGLAPSLLVALEGLASELPFVGVAHESLQLLQGASPARFNALVPALLASDRSYLQLHVVREHVSCLRQDLLPHAFATGPVTGRFASGSTSWVLDFTSGLPTWTARLQTEYATQLAHVTADAEAAVPTLRFAIDRLAELAHADATPLLAFAADPRQPVREIAIDAAARLDAGQGFDTLVACLGDDRARWAIYALRSLFRELPQRDVVARLRAVPRTTVTVAKEVVRLLGELGGAEGLAEILTFDLPTTKRDVRIAMLRSLWSHLHRPEVWPAFERAASDPDWVVASRIADVPMSALDEEAERRLGELLAEVLDRPESDLRVDLLKRAAWLPLRDRSRRFFGAVLRRIGAEAAEEAQHATRATLERMQSTEVDAVVAVVATVLTGRRNASTVLDALRPRPHEAEHRRKVAMHVLDRALADRRATVAALGFAGGFVEAARLGQILRSLDGEDRLDVDALAAALHAIDASTQPQVIEELLRASPSALLRRCALQALASGGRRLGWTRERRARLAGYRADPADVVASAAEWTFPPPLKQPD